VEERRYFPMPATFVITHYADDVEYRADGMIEKNVDKCHDFLRTLCVEGGGGGGSAMMRDPLCLLLLRRGLGLEDDGGAVEEEGAGARGRLRTVAGMFKRQLLENDGDRVSGLIPTLENTHMHFVRCLKPNDFKRALLFERSKVAAQRARMRVLLIRMHACACAADTYATQVAGQLSSNGVVEAVKLAQAGGLPTRYNYDELWDRKGMDMGVLLRAHWRRTGTSFLVLLVQKDTCVLLY
jgi:myosin heavy subunit